MNKKYTLTRLPELNVPETAELAVPPSERVADDIPKEVATAELKFLRKSRIASRHHRGYPRRYPRK